MCAKIDIDVHGIKKVGELLEDGVKAAAEDSRDELLEIGQDNARSIIVSRDAIWKSELYRSIKTAKYSTPASKGGSVFSHASHAAPVEHGAQYTTEGPPVKALIPWVKSKMGGGGGFVGYTPGFSDIAEDKDIPGEKSPAEILKESNIDTSEARFFGEDEFDLETHSYVGQDVIHYDSFLDEHRDATIISKTSVDYKIRYADGEEEVILSPDRYDVRYAQPKETLSGEELRGSIKEILNERIEYQAQNEDALWDVEDVFEESVELLVSGIDDIEFERRLEHGLSKLPIVQDHGHSKNIRGSLRSSDFGFPEHLYIDVKDADSREAAVASGAHELVHLINIYGWNDKRSVSERVLPENKYSKRGEHANPKNNKGFVEFDYSSDFTEKDADHFPEDYNKGHGDAWEYFLEFQDEEKQEQLDYFGDSIRDDINNGVIDFPDDSKFEPVFLETEMFGEGGDASVGESVLVHTDTFGDVKLRVESVGEESVLIGKNGEIWTAEVRDDGVRFKAKESEFSGTFSFDIADGSSIRRFKDYTTEGDIDNYYETVNRVWLRSVLARDEFSDYDTAISFTPNVDFYSYVSGEETATNLMETFVSSNKMTEGAAVNLYTKHPDAFYIMNKVYEPSEEFKNELEEKFNTDYFNLVQRIAPDG